MRPDHDLDAGALIRRVACLLALGALPLHAQLHRGIVRDSVTRAPVAGVVVSAIDSAGRPLARTLSNQEGQYSLLIPPLAARVRIQRIGYRVRESPFTASPDESVSLDLTIAPLPSVLERVDVVGAAQCPKRRDNADAQALLEQARAALLATIVARDANPASVVRYAYDRPVMAWPDSAPVHVSIDSARESTTSFKTVFSGEELVRFGFKRKVGDRWEYAGADAEVLLDDGFAKGYCFSIADRDRTRRSQIGLSFAAATREPGRVDIVGTLWIDTVARALRMIDYRYTGAEGLARFLDTGGRTFFQEMPNGVVAVTQWSVRLLNERVDSADDGAGHKRAVRGIVQNEGGGYLARATWPDGTTWVAPMGTARFVLMLNDTTPVVGAEIRLADTDYHGRTDSAGRVQLRDLFPGRYRLVVRDTLLEELGIEATPQFEFVSVAGGVVEGRARVQSAAEQLMRRCSGKPSRTDVVAVVNVKDASVGAPGVKVNVTYGNRVVSETTSPTGSLVLCFDHNAMGAPISLVGTRGDMQTQKVDHVINRRVMLFRLQLAPKPPSPGNAVARDPH